MRLIESILSNMKFMYFENNLNHQKQSNTNYIFIYYNFYSNYPNQQKLFLEHMLSLYVQFDHILSI